VVPGQLVIARCDASNIKSFNLLNALSIRQRKPVEALAEAEPRLPVAAVGNDWFGFTLRQFIARLVAVVGLVAAQRSAGSTRSMRRSATGQSCASSPVNRSAIRRPLDQKL